MKKHIKRTILSFFLLILFGSINLASADTTPEIESIFNWAENNFPEFFSEPQATQMIGVWTFRHYPAGPSGEVYVGVKNNEVFVLGGPWGTDNPTFIDTVPNLLNQIASSGGDGSVSGCSNTTDIPAGVVITQSGNVINITTNGQCIVIPTDSGNFCEPPEQPEPTGISVLTTVNVTSSQTTGIEVDQPGIPNPLDSATQGLSNSSCTINADSESGNQIINSDICIDMTDQLSSIPAGFGITINPPVTFAIVSTATNQVVSDCFATDAATVSDAFTGELWAKGADGNFVQISF